MKSPSIIRSFPNTRLRRLRYSKTIRQMCSEHQVLAQHLILPVFVSDSGSDVEAVPSMPGVSRYSLERLFELAEESLQAQVKTWALFPVVDRQLRTLDAKEAYNEKGLIQNTIRELKRRFPELCLISDVALDPYTSHGQDGLVRSSDGYVQNDETSHVLAKQALSHARAGADIVAPSDMMDGRIRAIRSLLEQEHCTETAILSYAAKYASSLYGPFRDAVGSSATLGSKDKHQYQMHVANSDEALHEVALDLSEGADIVMVKPGVFYLDIVQRVKSTFSVPTFVYQVSGEYAMIKAAAQAGWLEEKEIVLESLLCFRRAGADAILTYFALDAAKYLNQK